MSHKFSLSFNIRRSSKATIHFEGSNLHDRFDQDEMPAFEKFPKGSHAGRRQSRKGRPDGDK
ncbi:MAG: hypothetical protein ABSG91_23695 [Syntrophobacteraceae bacterium]